LAAVAEIGDNSNFNYVVFGHTHLPKHIKVSCRDRQVTYLNTGTWADTMRIPNTVFANDAIENGELKNFVEDLKANRLDSYIKRQLSYVEIEIENNRVKIAELKEFSGAEIVPK
jgi:predicted phosphodiesterase